MQIYKHTCILKILKFTGLLGFLLNVNTSITLAQPAHPPFEQAGFLFELQNCNQTSNKNAPLVCEFLIENTLEGRRQFNLYANQSRLIDTEGNEIRGITSNLGNRQDTNQNPYPCPTYQYVCNQYQPGIVLVSGIPIKGIITFEKIPEGNIRLIDLLCYAPDTNYFNVEFFF